MWSPHVSIIIATLFLAEARTADGESSESEPIQDPSLTLGGFSSYSNQSDLLTGENICTKQETLVQIFGLHKVNSLYFPDTLFLRKSESKFHIMFEPIPGVGRCHQDAPDTKL